MRWGVARRGTCVGEKLEGGALLRSVPPAQQMSLTPSSSENTTLRQVGSTSAYNLVQYLLGIFFCDLLESTKYNMIFTEKIILPPPKMFLKC